jgi:hypothetical protein
VRPAAGAVHATGRGDLGRTDRTRVRSAVEVAALDLCQQAGELRGGQPEAAAAGVLGVPDPGEPGRQPRHLDARLVVDRAAVGTLTSVHHHSMASNRRSITTREASSDAALTAHSRIGTERCYRQPHGRAKKRGTVSAAWLTG